MVKNKVLNKYSKKELDRVIYLCDNLFYNNYLDTGVLQSKQEIQDHIKTQVTESFVQFWGPQHADKITKKIVNTKIHFVYQVCGPTNSIDNFLISEKSKRFNQFNKTEFANPVFFKYAAKLFRNPFVNAGKTLQKTLSGELVPLNLLNCLKELKVEMAEIINDETLANKVVSQIKDYGKKYNNTNFSDDSKINDDLQFLQKFVNKVARDVVATCKVNGIDYNEAIYQNLYGTEIDPIVLSKHYDDNVAAMLRRQNILALRDQNSSNIYLGIRPGDETVLHEFVHEVENVGFEDGESECVKLFYTDATRHYEMFNEVITDYIAVLINKQRIKDGKQKIVGGKEFDSSYSELFGVMGKFLDSYLPELKETRMREYPAEEFQRVIGQKNFETIAVLCNELIALKNDLEVCKGLQGDGYTISDLMADKGECFYGSMDFFTNQIANIDDSATKELGKTLNRALRKQSLTKQVNLFLQKQSQNVADYLEQTKNPKLSKLAPVFMNASKVFKDKVQIEALKKLKAPIKKDIVKQPLLLEDKTQESATTAEK